jgi:hypothetical protein
MAMSTKEKVGLAACVLLGTGLVLAARYVTFAYGLREFVVGCLMGCVGIGMTIGGLAGTANAYGIRAGTIRDTVPPQSDPLAKAWKLGFKVCLIAIAAVLFIAVAVFIISLLALAGCCR